MPLQPARSKCLPLLKMKMTYNTTRKNIRCTEDIVSDEIENETNSPKSFHDALMRAFGDGELGGECWSDLVNEKLHENRWYKLNDK